MRNPFKSNRSDCFLNEKASYTEEQPTTDENYHLSGVPTAWNICSMHWNISSTRWDIYSKCRNNQKAT